MTESRAKMRDDASGKENQGGNKEPQILGAGDRLLGGLAAPG